MPSLHKLRLVLLSTGSVLALALGVYGGLTAVARWAERHDGYPWREEDYLRYILPSLHEGRGPHRIFLAGPSEVREDLIYQRFEDAFDGMDAFQGGQSLGTFDDLLIALDYMDRVFDPDARPHTLVLGITPRFVANIISVKQQPVVASINQYSPFYRVEPTPEGSRLVPKTPLEGLNSRLRFLPKLRKRYHTAIAAVVNRVVGDDLPYDAYAERFFLQNERPGSYSRIVLETVRRYGLWTSLGRWSAVYISPYRYHHLAPRPTKIIRSWIQDSTSFWFQVHAWDPADDAPLIRRQFDRLLALADRWGTRVYVVNLPEHPLNRAGYRPGYYERYLDLVRASLKDTPFLDLREMIPAEGFYDAGHLTLPSALRVTDRVIAFMKTH